MYVPPIDPKAEAYPGAREAIAAVGPPRQENADWRQAAAQREAEAQERIEEAKRTRVYVAKGPIIGAILIANLITAAVVWLLYAVTH